MEKRREPVDAAELMSQFGSEQPLNTVGLPDGAP